jgi:hypothetical protein
MVHNVNHGSFGVNEKISKGNVPGSFRKLEKGSSRKGVKKGAGPRYVTNITQINQLPENII